MYVNPKKKNNGYKLFDNSPILIRYISNPNVYPSKSHVVLFNDGCQINAL